MKKDKDTVYMYMSEWGDFQIPKRILKYLVEGKPYNVQPVKGIDSRHFWNWLHKEEVKAGKPEDS